MEQFKLRKSIRIPTIFKLVYILLTVATIFLPLSTLAAHDSCSAPLGIQNFGVDRFLDAIASGKFLSLEHALCLIPEKIRRNAVLVNNSISLQGGTLENPRAIMFDIGASNEPVQFAISYNGHPSQSQFSSFEIMKFDSSKKPKDQIEFFDVHFDETGARPTITRNPHSCLACHGFRTDIPRPLWDATGFQPSAYGGRQSSTFLTTLGSDEANLAQKFIDSYMANSRYKNLGPLDIEVIRDVKKSNIFVVQEDLEKPFVLIKSDSLSARNDLFGQRLAIINRRRVAELIQESKDYDKYKFAIASAFSRCDFVADTIPAGVRMNHSNLYGIDEELIPPLSDSKVMLAQEHKSDMFSQPHGTQINLDGFQKILAFRKAQLSDEVLPYFIDTEASALQWGGLDAVRAANLRWLFEPREINMASWNMDATGFSQGFYRFINYGAHNASREDLTLYFQELIKADRDLQATFDSYGISAEVTAEKFIESMHAADNDRLCSGLKTKSLNSFK